MSANKWNEIVGIFDALDVAMDRMLGLSWEALTMLERLAWLECYEAVRRQLSAFENQLIDQVVERADDRRWR